MNVQFPGAVPEIPVSDLKKALSYYESNLGFTTSIKALGIA
jgi:predicted enzyme related to lactoylglutathione lyase